MDIKIWSKKWESLHKKIFYMNQTAWSLKYFSSIKIEQQMIEARAFFLAENNGMEFWHLVSWIEWYVLINTKKNSEDQFALTVWKTTVVMKSSKSTKIMQSVQNPEQIESKEKLHSRVPDESLCSVTLQQNH